MCLNCCNKKDFLLSIQLWSVHKVKMVSIVHPPPPSLSLPIAVLQRICLLISHPVNTGERAVPGLASVQTCSGKALEHQKSQVLSVGGSSILRGWFFSKLSDRNSTACRSTQAHNSSHSNMLDHMLVCAHQIPTHLCCLLLLIRLRS